MKPVALFSGVFVGGILIALGMFTACGLVVWP